MIGTKFNKPLTDLEAYTKCANWCNQNNATIEDKGEYYECVAIPAPSLDELKQQKIDTFKYYRNIEEIEPIEYQGYSFDYDDKARERINAAIIALELQGEGATIEWTTADNADVKVTANDLRMVIAAVAQRSNALHVAYREAKAKVEQATTVAEVEAVTLDA